MEDGSAADVIVVSRLPAGGTGGFWDGMAGVPCRAGRGGTWLGSFVCFGGFRFVALVRCGCSNKPAAKRSLGRSGGRA